LKKSTFTAAAILLSFGLSACGGGGGGGNDQVVTPPVPVVPAVATVNAADAMAKILGTDQTIHDLPSNDGSLGTATLIVRSEQSYPFVSNGVAQQTAFTKVIQLQESGPDGRLQRQYLWKLHLDAQMKPVGMAVGNALSSYNECLSVSSKNDLPTSTSSSGVFFSGVQTTNYSETFKAGTYAHYCNPAAGEAAKIEWSVATGAPSPYFCITMPDSYRAPKTRICVPVEKTGALNQSIWIRILNSDGTSFIDYKNTALNKPVEQFSTTIDSKNYWYGAVWRPLDGYIYQSYSDTKFSSQQACRDQTTVDWKKTWSAGNISWTCVNVQSK
jgi:hypothetical protein